MISNERTVYGSASEWLQALRNDELWTNQQKMLQGSSENDLAACSNEALGLIGNGITFSYWKMYQHRVEPVVTELWEMAELSLPKLKLQTIGMLSMEWIEKRTAASGASHKTDEKEEQNLFAPQKHLQELLRQKWFKELRTNDDYDAAWTDAFVEALMASEWKDGIANDWAIKGERKKTTQIKGFVVGLLKDNGVLKGSYDGIASKVGLTEPSRTFSRYMSQGKNQPYADWVKEYVTNH